MTVEPAAVPAGDVAARLAELTDLFRRRLLDDREKRLMIQDLSARLDRAERRREPELLRPLVRQLALVVDRMDEAADGPGVLTSCAEEILDVLAVHGIEEVPASGPVDSSHHEVVDVEGDGACALAIARTVRRGYRLDGRVIRPAQVIATRQHAP